MAKRKESMSEGKKNIIAALIDEYDIETAEDIQNTVKDLLGGAIKSMPALKLVFINGSGRNTDVLLLAKGIGETIINKLDVVFLDHLHDVLGVHFHSW